MKIFEPKPPRAVGYAVEIGVVALALSLFGRPVASVVDAGQRVIDALIGGAVLYGIYRMQRWAVWAHLALTASIGLVAVGLVGLGGWRGLLFGVILRLSIVVPSLYYWKRLS